MPHRDLDLSEISARYTYDGREVLEVELILDQVLDDTRSRISFFRNPFLPVQVNLRHGVLETFPWLISPLWGLVAQYAPAEQLKFEVLAQY